MITVNSIFVENDMKYRTKWKNLISSFLIHPYLIETNLFGTDNTMQIKIYGNYKNEFLEFLDLNANFFI